MKKALYILYLTCQVLIIAACIYLPLTFGFKVEYILLAVQSIVVLAYSRALNPDSATNKKKSKNEVSLFIAVLFVGILYIAAFHYLIVALSVFVLAGWFFFSGKSKSQQ
ncbi:MAG: hypothetical protein AAFQ94_00815 [Bacteroidota bacterium]